MSTASTAKDVSAVATAAETSAQLLQKVSALDGSYFLLPKSSLVKMPGPDVKEPDNKTELRKVSQPIPIPKPIGNLRSAMKSSMKMGQTKIVKANLPFNFSSTSAANSAQIILWSLCPANASEFGQWAYLFDEFICDGFTMYLRLYNSSGANTSGTDGAVAYDPQNSSSYGSVNGVLEAQQHFGPFVTGPSTSGIVAAPAAYTPTGFWKFQVKCPQGPQVKDPDIVSIVGTGNWTSTGVVTTNYGYLKGYIEAAVGTTTLVGHVIAHCRFRCRT